MIKVSFEFRIFCRYFVTTFAWSQKSVKSDLPAMKILNVAEKNDAAKNIAYFLSGGHSRKREGLSKYNKIYEFEYTVFGQRSQMIMTSVSGHLLGMDFVSGYRKWSSCSPLLLFEAPIVKFCPKDYEQIKKTLEREVRSCATLIIWTDCDREGENIGFEIIQVCSSVKPNLRIYRAKFSEITAASVHRAIQNLAEPNKQISDAVDVRQELDLRIGAAFTRFQTLRLQKVFPEKLSDSLISYGSCQFPTLGFVVERYKAVDSFIPELFWKISVSHTIEELTVAFTWKRVRLFDQLACQVLYEVCMENPTATVESVQSKPKSKWRPLPLDTVELEKLASRKLKLNARDTMKIAEKLYTQGFISYPRTETNIFPREMNLRSIVEQQTEDARWGEFAGRVLQDGPNPRVGKKSDQAHPPIHPTKYTNSLTGNEQRLYEFIVRHFLACCSKDAEGLETIVDIDIAGEKFVASGLMIIARNYLDVYPYEKWNAKEIHIYQNNQKFKPTTIEMVDGETSPPNLLTEADLIALMEKHGIGTDATHADHIETIKQRSYVGLENQMYFVPGCLGMGLVEGYDSMGFPMSKPNLRAELEIDLKRICEGTKDPKIVLTEQLAKYKEVFRIALEQAAKIDEALGKSFNEQPRLVEEETSIGHEGASAVCKCPSCGLDMVPKSRRDNQGWYIGCMGFPACRNAVWLPSCVQHVEVKNEHCRQCGPDVKLVHFKFSQDRARAYYGSEHTGCLGGCDQQLLELLDVGAITACGQNTPRSTVSRSFDSGVGTFTQGGRTQQRPSHGDNRPPSQQQDNPLSNFSQSFQRNNRTVGSTSGWATGNAVGATVSARNPRGVNSGSTFVSLDRDNSQSRNNENPRRNVNWGGQSFVNPATRTDNRSRSDSGNNAVMCGCSVNAILLTVRKEGPNTGRQFYKCGNPAQQCNFFIWADEDPAEMPEERNVNSPMWRPNQNFTGPGREAENSGDTEVCCNCGQSAVMRTVQKDTPNKGRQFYCCPKQPNERCNFFQWVDEPNTARGGTSNNDWGSRGSKWNGNGSGASTSWQTNAGRGRGTFGKRTLPSPSGARKRRKCGVCGEEGHNRKNCSHNPS
ncbi:DNA topoisomerase 3-alpha isoform X1 [Schistocerca nitens]|uniref:DNA topoisomerase 3-alpha isoform X1 n=1 Tax=Schistocerca nitens TaxID=7011 RepID=UPI0021173491|nr:DNA topoisomerase 3-alpha isoform X1 [Schistocerca nitens]